MPWPCQPPKQVVVKVRKICILALKLVQSVVRIGSSWQAAQISSLHSTVIALVCVRNGGAVLAFYDKKQGQPPVLFASGILWTRPSRGPAVRHSPPLLPRQINGLQGIFGEQVNLSLLNTHNS